MGGGGGCCRRSGGTGVIVVVIVDGPVRVDAVAGPVRVDAVVGPVRRAVRGGRRHRRRITGRGVHVHVDVLVVGRARGDRRRGRPVERVVRRAVRHIMAVLGGHLGRDAGHGHYQQYHADGDALQAEHGQAGQQRGDHAQLVHDRQHDQLQPSPVYAERPRVYKIRQRRTLRE